MALSLAFIGFDCNPALDNRSHPYYRNTMTQSTITSKYQATVPQDIRKFLGLKAGDKISFEIERDKVIVRRQEGLDRQYLNGLETQLSEWLSDEDEAAFRHL
jgi:antitoxin PrlF